MRRMAGKNINTLEYWNGRYATGKGHSWDPQSIVPEMASRIPRGHTVLDVGVGAGCVSNLLGCRRPDLAFLACDISDEAIRRLPHGSARFKEAFVWDIRSPWMREKPYADTVICTELLEHLERPKAAVAKLAELARWLVVVTVPNRLACRSPEHVWAYGHDDVRRLLEPYGNVETVDVRRNRNIMGVLWRRPL